MNWHKISTKCQIIIEEVLRVSEAVAHRVRWFRKRGNGGATEGQVPNDDHVCIYTQQNEFACPVTLYASIRDGAIRPKIVKVYLEALRNHKWIQVGQLKVDISCEPAAASLHAFDNGSELKARFRVGTQDGPAPSPPTTARVNLVRAREVAPSSISDSTSTSSPRQSLMGGAFALGGRLIELAKVFSHSWPAMPLGTLVFPIAAGALQFDWLQEDDVGHEFVGALQKKNVDFISVLALIKITTDRAVPCPRALRELALNLCHAFCQQIVGKVGLPDQAELFVQGVLQGESVRDLRQIIDAADFSTVASFPPELKPWLKLQVGLAVDALLVNAFVALMGRITIDLGRRWKLSVEGFPGSSELAALILNCAHVSEHPEDLRKEIAAHLDPLLCFLVLANISLEAENRVLELGRFIDLYDIDPTAPAPLFEPLINDKFEDAGLNAEGWNRVHLDAQLYQTMPWLSKHTAGPG